MVNLTQEARESITPLRTLLVWGSLGLAAINLTNQHATKIVAC